MVTTSKVVAIFIDARTRPSRKGTCPRMPDHDKDHPPPSLGPRGRRFVETVLPAVIRQPPGGSRCKLGVFPQREDLLDFLSNNVILAADLQVRWGAIRVGRWQ